MPRGVPILFLLMILVALPAFADTDPPAADPRDQEIRELKRLLEQQQQQIDQLNQAVRELLEARQAPPEPPSAAAPPEDLAPEDPGPDAPPPAPIQQQAGTQSTGQQPALNPNISVVGLFGGMAGGRPDDDKANTLFVDEVEVALQAPVDPNTRLDAFVSFPRNEAPEIEEAYATYLGLPGGLQARGGLMLTDFGRINPLHTHALPQIDRPLPVAEYLGGHGLNSPGLELSWLAPLPWYSKLVVGATSRYGHAHGAEEEHAAEEEHSEGEEGEEGEEHLDEPVAPEFALFPAGGSTKPLWNARLENLFDLDEDTTLMLGLSGATSVVEDGYLKSSSLGGADLTLKWRPLGGQGENLVWQSEALFGRRDFVDPALPRQAFSGWYSYLNYQWNRNWLAGVRYDEADTVHGDPGRQRRATALLQYMPSEWNALRLQYSRYLPTFDRPVNEVQVQWNVVIGPHGAHKY